VREFRARQESRIAHARLQTALFRPMTDAQMVVANRKEGLGLGIRPEKIALSVGEPLKLHLAFENVAARGPVSATTCQGFSIGSEDEETMMSTSVAVRFACPEEDWNRDNHVALRRGELKSAELSTGETKLIFRHPGDYIVIAGWQAFRTRDGMFQRGDEYAVMASNRVLITVR